MAKKKEIKPIKTGAAVLIGVAIGIVMCLIFYYGFVMGSI